jgi:hypothetical protein
MSNHDQKHDMNDEAGNGRSRILARQLARPLSADEIDVVSGARAALASVGVGALRAVDGGTCSAGTCCCPDCDD